MKKIVLDNMKIAILDQEPSLENVFLLGKVADRADKIKEKTVDFCLIDDGNLDPAEVTEYIGKNFDELYPEAAKAAYEDLLTYEEEEDD